MIINRHNYEEFFLMYVDDELTAEERAAVELFTQQNPDLAPELDLFMQTKLPADDTHMFGNKNELLHSIQTTGIDNYEEQFLLYVDNELTKERRNDVEKFVLQHPQFQDEFTLLKQTILSAEIVVFEDKASLLRKDERRVIPMFLRFAEAAALTGIAVMIWWMWNNNKTTIIPSVASVQTDTTKKNTEENTASVTEPGNNIVLPEVKITPKQETQKEETAVAIIKEERKQKIEVSPAPVQNNAVQKDLVAVNNNQVKNNNTVTVTKPDVTHDVEPANVAVPVNNNTTDYAANTTNQQHDNTRGIIVTTGNDATNNNTYASNAVYKELNTEEEDNRQALYLGSLQINKNKVRGIVKKVGGLFSGKSKDAAKEDGKLQIANLELNTN